jgi:hypothetical protein
MDKDAFNDDVIGYGTYNMVQFLQTRMNTTSKQLSKQLWSISCTKEAMPAESPLESNLETVWVWEDQ